MNSQRGGVICYLPTSHAAPFGHLIAGIGGIQVRDLTEINAAKLWTPQHVEGVCRYLLSIGRWWWMPACKNPVAQAVAAQFRCSGCGAEDEIRKSGAFGVRMPGARNRAEVLPG